MNSFSSMSDDFGYSMYISSKTELNPSRESMLHFFESLQKQYPTLTDFEKRDNNEYAIEEDRDGGSYRWITLENRRVCSGFVNPPTLEEADQQNERILEMVPYHLNISTLDADALDLVCYFDFAYSGNHDEAVAEALASGGALESLSQTSGARVLQFQPSMTLALDEACTLQARLTVETRSTAYQVRTGQFSEAPISVYFTLRQFWGKQPFKTFLESYRNQRRILEEMVTDVVWPSIVQPLARTLGAKQ